MQTIDKTYNLYVNGKYADQGDFPSRDAALAAAIAANPNTIVTVEEALTLMEELSKRTGVSVEALKKVFDEANNLAYESEMNLQDFYYNQEWSHQPIP